MVGLMCTSLPPVWSKGRMVGSECASRAHQNGQEARSRGGRRDTGDGEKEVDQMVILVTHASVVVMWLQPKVS